MPEQTQDIYVLADVLVPCCLLLFPLLAFEIHKEHWIHKVNTVLCPEYLSEWQKLKTVEQRTGRGLGEVS